MAVRGTAIQWPTWDDPLTGEGSFRSGPQPVPAGDATSADPFNNVLNPIPLIRWGSLKTSGRLVSAFARIDLADPVGGDRGGEFAPDPGVQVAKAELLMRVSSATQSVQVGEFTTSLYFVAPDGIWDVELNTDIHVVRGMQAFAFEAQDPLGAAFDGPPVPTPVVELFHLNQVAGSGAVRVAQSFETPVAGVTFGFALVGAQVVDTFVVGETLTARLYPCIANDGSNDAPQAVAPIGTSEDIEISSIPTGFQQLIFDFTSTPRPLVGSTRFCVVVTGNWTPDGRILRIFAAASFGTTGLDGHLCTMSSPGVTPATQNPGFVGYESSYNLPQVLDSVGTELAGTLRETAPHPIPNNWPTPLLGPFPIVTPTFGTVPGVIVRMDITAAFQAFLDRPAYVAEQAASIGNTVPMPVGIALAMAFVDADNEREADQLTLEVSFGQQAFCADADQVVTARAAVTSSRTADRAGATMSAADRAGVTNSHTRDRGGASQTVADRGAATQIICVKE